MPRIHVYNTYMFLSAPLLMNHSIYPKVTFRYLGTMLQNIYFNPQKTSANQSRKIKYLHILIIVGIFLLQNS